MRKQKFNKEEVRKARQTNLAEYCQFIGLEVEEVGMNNENVQYQLIDRTRSKQEQRTSCYITANAYYRFSTGNGGNAIDFCVNELNMKVDEAIQKLLDFQNGVGASEFHALNQNPVSNTSSKSNHKIHKEKFVPEKEVFAEYCSDVIDYLCRERKIDYKIIKPLLDNGLLKQDARGNVCFCRYDVENNLIGMEKHGTCTDRRYKATSGQKGFFLSYGEAKTICLFESAIDLLSFAELYSEKLTAHLLVSMGGLNGLAEELKENYPDAELFCCVDNDKSGNKFASHCVQLGYQRFQPKTCKDWNDFLKLKKSKSNSDNPAIESKGCSMSELAMELDEYNQGLVTTAGLSDELLTYLKIVRPEKTIKLNPQYFTKLKKERAEQKSAQRNYAKNRKKSTKPVVIPSIPSVVIPQAQACYAPQASESQYQLLVDNRPQREKSRAKRKNVYNNDNIIKFVQYILATPNFSNSFKMIQTMRGRNAENGFQTVAFFPQNQELEVKWWVNSVCFQNRNYYITKNSYKGSARRTESLFSLDNIVIDIDNHKSNPKVIDREIERLIYFLDNDANLPSYGIVYTGRGVQLWIGLESVYASEKLKYRYEQLSKKFCDIIEEVIKDNHIKLDVDRSASIRVNGLVKLPGTRNMNRKGENLITYERFPLERYSIQELLLDYADVDLSYFDLPVGTVMPEKRTFTSTEKPKRIYKAKSNGDYTAYLMKRVRFIEQLVSARHGECEGCRELLLFHYYNSAIQVYDKTNAVNMVKALNQQFTKPLHSAEVGCAIHSPDKKIYHYTVEKFLVELHTTEKERVMYDNCTLDREQEREKARQKKKERNQHIIALHKQGMKQQDIADVVKCCRRTVCTVLKPIIAEEKEERNKKVQELHSQNLKQQDIANASGCCKRTVANLVKEYAESNKVNRNKKIMFLYHQEVSRQAIADTVNCSKPTVITVINSFITGANANSDVRRLHKSSYRKQIRLYHITNNHAVKKMQNVQKPP